MALVDILRRILVVDDAPELLALLTQLFGDEGYRVVGVGTMAEAVARLGRDAFDLVVTDSFATTPAAALTSTTAVRQAAGALPVILLTAHMVAVADAVAAGFRTVVQKPFDLENLLGEVQGALL